MDSERLAALEHQNMVGAMSLLGSMANGGVARRADGMALVSTGLDLLLFNQVLVDDDAATPAAMAAAVSEMRERGARFAVNLRVGADDRFVPLVGELGLVPLSADPWMPGMALHPLPPLGPATFLPGHEVRQVRDAAGLDDHIRTGAAGFELPEPTYRAVLPLDVLSREGATVYVGYTDGQPVSTGFGYRTGNTIGVYSIATLPAARGRGYGAAMTMRVAADGAAGGCELAILQASAMGYPIYQRLGYRTVVEYMAYVDPAPSS